MTSCVHGPIADYTFCEKCVVLRGHKITKTICSRCRTLMAEVNLFNEAPTSEDLTEFDFRDHCEICTPTEKRPTPNDAPFTRYVAPDHSPVHRRLLDDLALDLGIRAESGKAEPPRRAALGRIHSAWHAYQAWCGIRKCRDCNTLTSNRFRPMSHQFSPTSVR